MKGRALAQVLVPSVASVPFVFEISETDSASGRFVRDLVELHINFITQLNPSVIDSIEATITNAEGMTETVTLVETGPASLVFADATEDVVVRVEQQSLPDLPIAVIDATLTNSRLDIQATELTLIETESDSNRFESTTEQIVDFYDTADFETWTLTASEVVVLGQSEGGEFKPYLLQIRGPPQFLDQVEGVDTEDGMRAVAKSLDGNYYVQTSASVPSIYLYLQAIDETVLSGDAGDFFFGFAKGFGGGAWAMVEGLALIAKFLLKEGLRLSPVGFPVVMLFGDRYESEIAFARGAADITFTLAKVSLAIQQNQQELMFALLTGDMQEVAVLSTPYVIGLQFTVEILQALWEEFALSPPHEQGEIVGRAVFEIVALALIFGKAGQLRNLTKVGFIDKLKTVKFFQGPRVSQVFTRISTFLEELRITKMCFLAGTPIHTLAGTKPIEEIGIDDYVLARDPETGELDYKRVVNTVVTHPSTLYHVYYRVLAPGTNDGTPQSQLLGNSDSLGAQEKLSTTAEHPFYVLNAADFVPAKDLSIGDLLFLSDGGRATVTGVEIEHAETGLFTTYNFEVEDFRTYHAGESGVWVHNAATKSCINLFAAFNNLRARGRSLEQIFRVFEKFRKPLRVVGIPARWPTRPRLRRSSNWGTR